MNRFWIFVGVSICMCLGDFVGPAPMWAPSGIFGAGLMWAAISFLERNRVES